MLLHDHPGGVNSYEELFWTAADLLDLGQQLKLYTKTILVTRKSWTFQNYDMDSRSPPSLLICAI